MTVALVGGRFYGMPKILQGAKSAVLPVPERAANSQVTGPGCGVSGRNWRAAFIGRTKIPTEFLEIYYFLKSK